MSPSQTDNESFPRCTDCTLACPGEVSPPLAIIQLTGLILTVNTVNAPHPMLGSWCRSTPHRPRTGPEEGRHHHNVVPCSTTLRALLQIVSPQAGVMNIDVAASSSLPTLPLVWINECKLDRSSKTRLLLRRSVACCLAILILWVSDPPANRLPGSPWLKTYIAYH